MISDCYVADQISRIEIDFLKKKTRVKKGKPSQVPTTSKDEDRIDENSRLLYYHNTVSCFYPLLDESYFKIFHCRIDFSEIRLYYRPTTVCLAFSNANGCAFAILNVASSYNRVNSVSDASKKTKTSQLDLDSN